MAKALTEVERMRRDNQALRDAESKAFQRVRQLERELKDIGREKDTAEDVRKTIYRLSAQTPHPPKWVSRTKSRGLPGVPMTMWSDWHWGEVVNPVEVGGVNAYNRAIAKQRLQLLTTNSKL